MALVALAHQHGPDLCFKELLLLTGRDRGGTEPLKLSQCTKECSKTQQKSGRKTGLKLHVSKGDMCLQYRLAAAEQDLWIHPAGDNFLGVSRIAWGYAPETGGPSPGQNPIEKVTPPRMIRPPWRNSSSP